MLYVLYKIDKGLGMDTKKFLIGLLILFFSLSSSATFNEATKLYDDGSYQQAFHEFEKLAKIGHKSSQFNLGVMYLEGTGVKQDLIKAYAWVKLSDEKANKERGFLEEIKGYINDKQKLMKAEEYYKAVKSEYGAGAIINKYKPEITDEKIVEKNTAIAIKRTNPDYPISA